MNRKRDFISKDETLVQRSQFIDREVVPIGTKQTFPGPPPPTLAHTPLCAVQLLK